MTDTTEKKPEDSKPVTEAVKETAEDVANTAAETSKAAATAAKDNVFSMFGGGPKKEKKEEEEVDEPSGSSKAQKDKTGESVCDSLLSQETYYVVLFRIALSHSADENYLGREPRSP